MTAVLVDKMVRTQIVDCAAVANWLFSPDMAHEFTRWIETDGSEIMSFCWVVQQLGGGQLEWKSKS